jgi:hypothetical protein
LIDTSGRRISNVLDIRSFKSADCGTAHYLVIPKVKERLAVSEKTKDRSYVEKLNVKKLNEVEDEEQCLVEIS